MQVDVIGGGAIGLLYGTRLAAAGADVIIWTRTERQSALLKEQGVRLIAADAVKELTIRLRSEWTGLVTSKLAHRDRQAPSLLPHRWIIVAVKQTDIGAELVEQILAIMTAYPGPSAIMCLQNGLGHIEQLSSGLGDIPIFTAVTTEGARRLDGRTVQHTGEGELWISERAENRDKLEGSLANSQIMLVNLLQSAGITVLLSNDMKNRIYYKLLINAVLNPLTAIYNVTNGQLPEQVHRYTLMKELFKESEAILLRDGMKQLEDGWELLLDVCYRTSGNISSMLSDIRAGRETEILAINGAIIAIAARHRLDAPLNSAVTAIIHAYMPKPKGKE